ncbi:AAA family ATPase [Streptobacillus felis]|uniref:AAA family ATPase n=1 Tax=Streptobacillus felis TaxID=1384509 RepID=A0A7Z0PFN8_9FUSO|nr:AAA family ATPase [Streptobacillus felis]NYV27931.1 AAA family ATPase [Streptobacillus felis]
MEVFCVKVAFLDTDLKFKYKGRSKVGRIHIDSEHKDLLSLFGEDELFRFDTYIDFEKFVEYLFRIKNIFLEKNVLKYNNSNLILNIISKNNEDDLNFEKIFLELSKNVNLELLENNKLKITKLKHEISEKRDYLVYNFDKLANVFFDSILGGVSKVCFEKCEDKILIYPKLEEDFQKIIINDLGEGIKDLIFCKQNKKNTNHNFTTIQKIYYGAPGTGKSYQVSELIKEKHGGEIISEYVFRTTIYPDYSYFNFIGTIMPTIKKDDKDKNDIITYDFVPGIFTQALKTALDNPEVNIFLVLEEMSRGNIAAIFGDIFQLLDRDETGRSEYEIRNDLITKYINDNIEDINLTEIFIPSNLHIIGTVNTSDQNVNVIDTAFKRRFDFEYSTVEPVENLNTATFNIANKEYEWNKFYTTLNKFITNDLKLSEDKQIGQFFIKFNEKMENEEILTILKNKLLHYLWEDVQGASLLESHSIFKSEYKRFLDIYKDFGNKEIFSKEFIDMYNENENNNVKSESKELE